MGRVKKWEKERRVQRNFEQEGGGRCLLANGQIRKAHTVM